MNRDPVTYDWPATPGASSPPVWTGTVFEVDGHRQAVLSYDSSASNWSTDLTAMHEFEAGPNHPIDAASRHLAIESIRRHAPAEHGWLLEVGSSSGYFLADLARLMPDVHLIGSDFLRQPLEAVATRLPGIPLVQFDLATCPLPSASLDVIVLLNVLEHIRDDAGAIRNIARLLKPNGLAYIEVPSCPACYDIYDEHLLHHRRYRLTELREQVCAAGFVVLRATHLGALPFPLFYLTKRRGRRLLALPAEQKTALVATRIRQTKQSCILDWLLKLELWLGRWIDYPFGIRCILVLRKTSQ